MECGYTVIEQCYDSGVAVVALLNNSIAAFHSAQRPSCPCSLPRFTGADNVRAANRQAQLSRPRKSRWLDFA
ncbi:hypothetical protein, partial [Mesorhizobium sp. M4A.F.Ca.ET.020.02.1.1]|uniref:hypothetical protein n=1 Tax=Mesorhizobium sp. M4A.F.Ca.ET.020.02.1.1 TaxID=2496652 RepID=UPI001AED0F9A